MAWIGSKSSAYVGAASGTQTVSLTDILDAGGSAITLQDGDVVFLGQTINSSSNIDMAALAPSGWTARGEQYANGSTHDCNAILFYKQMGASPDSSVDVANSGDANMGMSVGIQVVRSVDAAIFDVADVNNTGTGAGANPDPGAITPATANATILVFGFGAFGGSSAAPYNTPSDLSGFRTAAIESGTRDSMVGVGYKTWTSGAFDPEAWTGGPTGASSSWACNVVAIKPAAGSGTTYNETIGESSTAADTIAVAATFAPNISEGLTAAVTMASTMTMANALNEGAAAFDAVAGGLMITVTFAEAAAAGDDVVPGMAFFADFTEAALAQSSFAARFLWEPVDGIVGSWSDGGRPQDIWTLVNFGQNGGWQ